ncbi:transporter substrate-binding domain-containing protein [Sulfurimonas sp.]|uniref:transporter substrate-binding domain-containing diguanylate cyclase n=1 Tax=Sulfurimonas sp. TaxID=2022749 RepID=UPI0025E94F39|nr:transporter substrate-binding domain-containing protein [Sulfurimonas sp.]
MKYQKPLLFLNKDNHVVGIIQDYFNLLSKEIGIEISVDLRVIDKTAGHEVSKKNGNYGLASIFKHHKNEKDYLITDPYLFTNFIIFSNRKNKDKYKSLKDLEGKKVAIIRGHRMMESYFSKVKNIELVYASDAIQEMNMLQYGEVDAIVGYISYHNLIQDNLFTDISAAFTDTKRFPISMGINKEHKILHSLINKALAILSQDQKNEIISKWIKIRNIQKNEILTSKEIAYLKKKKVIKLCIDPDWMPFEKNENGKHIGMSAEYIKIIEKEIGTPIELLPTKTWSESLKLGLQRKCDVLSLVIPTKERKKYFHFTKSYLHIPLVIVTNIDEFFINDISKVVNKKIGIAKDYAFAEILKDKYPDMNIVEVKNIKDGLHQVENAKLFGFIGTLATTGYHIQKNYIGQLKIAGKFDEKLELGVAVRNDEPILRNIFDKVIAKIPADKEQAILNKWVSVNYDNDVNYKPVLQWIIGLGLLFITILLIILRANRKLNDEINNRKETEKKLQKLSITDELTSLYNRRYFNEIFPKLINSAKREKYNICFALLDIDFFKQYNDTYGHISGDQALQSLSACIKASMTRADDYCFRLGGEEFALIFKGHSPKEAIKFIEKVKQNIEDLKIEHKKNSASKYLTVSFGLAIKDATSIDDENELYREADILLYEAKNSGRNKICVSS